MSNFKLSDVVDLRSAIHVPKGNYVMGVFKQVEDIDKEKASEEMAKEREELQQYPHNKES